MPASSSFARALEDYRYAVLDLSPRTQRWYVEKLGVFERWCLKEGVELERLTPADYRRFIAELRGTINRYGNPISTYTLRGYAQVIKGFLNWCVREEAYGVSERLTPKLELPRVVHKVIQVFSRDQLRRLLTATEREQYKRLVVRDQAILRVLAGTGVRAGELCGLVLEDVHISLYDAHLKVFGKGRKEREVGLGRAARTTLHRYLSTYRRAPEVERHVFLNRDRTPMAPDGVDVMLRRLRDWAGGRYFEGVRVSAHTFRHTFAVEFLKQTGDIYKLSRLMGHASVKTTEIYLNAMKASDARQGVAVFEDL
jgi:site-specific recombinase XerD